MQKKLLAVAIAGAFGAPAVALAQSSTVQVFGTMYVEYSRVNQGGAVGGQDRSNTDFLQTPGSEVGFKGEEKLGGGLSAWFQCVTTADPRGQSQNGWCSRNSALGMKGGFGNLFIGNWDTPFKRTISPTAVGGNDTGIFGTAQILTGESTTTAVGANRTTFKRRQQNSINYDSPNFAGFQVLAAFTSTNPATGTLAGANNNKARVYSLGAQYSAGPLYVSAAYEQHQDFAGAAVANPNDSKDNGWHVGAAYTLGPVKFGGQYTRQKLDSSAADLEVSAWHLGVDWTIVGPHGLRAAFTQARDAKGPGAGTAAFTGLGVPTGGAGYRPAGGGDTGARLAQIRYVYTFSKRTEFTAGYVKLDNESNAAYRLYGLGTQIANGQDESAFAVAVRHTF